MPFRTVWPGGLSVGAWRAHHNPSPLQRETVRQPHLPVALQQPGWMAWRDAVDPVTVGERIAPETLVPLPAEEIRQFVTAVERFSFDRIYGAGWGANLVLCASEAGRLSAERYSRRFAGP